MTSINSERDFDRWAPDYDSSVLDDGAFPFDGYERVLDRVFELAAITPGAAVLELGVGTGNLSRKMIEAGADLWGADFSAEMLRTAQAKLPTAQLYRADVLQPLPEPLMRRYAVIASTYTFHEFDTADKLALLARLVDEHLLPDGRIVIGDIGFSDEAARENVRIAAGDAWDEEYFWSVAEAVGLAGQLNLNLELEPMSSCAYVLAFSRA